jgi:2-polyprenyl-3-methyl-5-hydroxy-6-metoxy-1,4-benzoquinol methylase
MLAGFTNLIKKHVRARFPLLRKLRRPRIAKSNLDYFGDPQTFLERALQNEYISKDTPEQIWRNLFQVCSDLKVPCAAERIAKYRQQHFGVNSETASIGTSQPKDVPYTHDELFFNMVAPRIIAGKLYSVLRPKSVIDVGCGLGTFLRAFKELGVETILGIDGDWVDRKQLSKHISLSEFRPADLQADFSVDARFDLVISLEVAEHLCPESAERFVKNLVALGDTILFSAATPLTWFDSSHLNNQWPDYWSEKFAAHAYIMQDVVRHLFYGNEDVCPWYRTNMFLVTKGKREDLSAKLTQISPVNIREMKRREACYPLLTNREHRM